MGVCGLLRRKKNEPQFGIKVQTSGGSINLFYSFDNINMSNI